MSMAALANPMLREAPRGWVDIGTAVALTGLSVRSWQVRCQQLEKSGLAGKYPPPSGCGKDVWWIDPGVDARFTLAGECPPDVDLSRYPQTAVERASQRLRWLREWLSRCDDNPRTPKRKIADRYIAEVRAADPAAQVSRSSLEGWSKLYREGGIRALIDKHDTRSRRVGADVDGDIGGRTRDPEAVEMFLTLYRSGQKNSIAACHEMTLRAAIKNNWRWPTSAGGTARWLRNFDNREETGRDRLGHDWWRHSAMPSIGIDYQTLAPGDFYVADHQQMNIFALDGGGGKIIRPWLTAIQDLASRVIVGWHIGPTPHSDAIAMAMRDAFGGWAVPRKLKVDNGRDFASKRFVGLTKAERRLLRAEHGKAARSVFRAETHRVDPNPAWLGLCAELGCELKFAKPFQPQSKGTVERFFGKVNTRWACFQATFCDTSPERKPEGLAEVLAGVTRDEAKRYRKRFGRDWRRVVGRLPNKTAVPTMDDVRRSFADFVVAYHNEPHAGSGMNGMTPIAAWSSKPKALGCAGDRSLNVLCSVRGTYTVGARGVTLTIGAARLGFGQLNPDLRRWFGREVLVACDERDVSHVLCLDPQTRELICVAGANDVLPADASSDDVRAAVRKQQRARRDAERARDSAPNRMRGVAAIAREDLAERARRLRATGTDDKRPAMSADDTIRIVQTGFEGASMEARNTIVAAQDDGDDEGDLLSEMGLDASPPVPPVMDDDGDDDDDSWIMQGPVTEDDDDEPDFDL